jgi:hypothetical protein
VSHRPCDVGKPWLPVPHRAPALLPLALAGSMQDKERECQTVYGASRVEKLWRKGKFEFFDLTGHVSQRRQAPRTAPA